MKSRLTRIVLICELALLIGGAGEVSIPQSVAARFSLDETFDVGEDTGTPVVEEYAAKMPYEFTGTLKKLAVVLEPDKLTDDERKKLMEELAKAVMGNQ